MSIEILPVEGLPEVRPGDDLAATLSAAITDLRDGDVLCVTQKVVSKAEGRLVPESDGHDTWVARETRRVVARRDDMVIAETRHGFVCANAGVDASNVEAGWLALLPEDPDASAEAIRRWLRRERGVDVGVVVTDTFGRPWRVGLVNVAIGCAGLPAVLDLRGSKDHVGRVLEATVVALADEVAAASGLVMGKDAMVPAAVVRGLTPSAPPGSARELVRPAEEDLFRESPLQAVRSRADASSFLPGDVPREAVVEAVLAAAAEGAPMRFVALLSTAAKRRVAGPVGDAPAVVVALIPGGGERVDVRLAAGGAVERFRLAMRAQGYASNLAPGPPGLAETLELGPGWEAAAVLACGRPAGEPARPPEPPIDDLLGSA